MKRIYKEKWKYLSWTMNISLTGNELTTRRVKEFSRGMHKYYQNMEQIVLELRLKI
jgi:hypothetical protein